MLNCLRVCPFYYSLVSDSMLLLSYFLEYLWFLRNFGSIRNHNLHNQKIKIKKTYYLFGGGVAMLAGLLDSILVDLVGLVVRCVVLICHLWNPNNTQILIILKKTQLVFSLLERERTNQERVRGSVKVLWLME